MLASALHQAHWPEVWHDFYQSEAEVAWEKQEAAGSVTPPDCSSLPKDA